MTSILILNGPNLNLLGTRQPEIYGHTTLSDVEEMCRSHGKSRGIDIACAQSNHEGALVTAIQEARGTHDGIIFNAGAYTHTSIALLDALRTVRQPIVEVHLSNIFRREAFRRHSYVAEAATGVICGFGVGGYLLALDAIDSEARAREAD